MIKIKVGTSDLKGMETRLRKSSSRSTRKSIADAVNSASRKHLNNTVKEIKKNLSKPTSYIKKFVRLGKRANSANMQMDIIVKWAERPELSEFKAQKTGGGISYQINPSDGRKTIKSAFMHKSKVFRRRGSQRLPIVNLKGVSVWGVVVKNDLVKKLEKQGRESLLFELNKKADEIVRRIGRG